jgi:hypothetical protein
MALVGKGAGLDTLKTRPYGENGAMMRAARMAWVAQWLGEAMRFTRRATPLSLHGRGARGEGARPFSPDKHLQNLIRLEEAIAGIASDLAQDAGGFELRQVIAGSLERHAQIFG